jgi:asparagine synthase (glutamine-hydrolysing)
MSGIFGIYNLNGVPVEREQLARMSKAIAHRGPDGENLSLFGVAGFGHRRLLTTAEAINECQPLADESGRLRLTFDGRLDNRDELRQEIIAHAIPLRDNTDAELVLKAYQLWGEACARHLLGDFAFAIWDEACKLIFCCRDPLGLKPFYFFTTDSTFAFASDPSAIFALPQVKKEPNPNGMIDYLFNNFVDSEPTEFKNLYRLRPAHSLLATSKGIRKSQYWDVDPDDQIHFRRPEEYTEAFLETFTRAIKAQLRCNTTTGVAFSGGFDSSSILCLIEHLRQQGAVLPKTVAYSAVFDGQVYDESHYMRSVQERWGAMIHWCRPQPPRPLWGLHEVVRGDAQPMNVPLAYPIQDIFKVAGSEGVRVLLAGIGGDDLMDAPMRLGAELLLKGRLSQAWEFTVAQSTFHSIPLLRPVEYCLVRPLIGNITPRFFKTLYARLRKSRSALSYVSQNYAAEGFRRWRAEPWYLRHRKFSSGSRCATYNAIHSGYRVQSLEWWDRLAAAGGVEARQPFFDRRVVEFVTRVPDPMMVMGFEPKGLLRSAMRPLFPERLMKRRDKADFTTLMNDCLINKDVDQANHILEDPLLARMGLIDVDKAQKTYQRYRLAYSSRLQDNLGIDIVWELLSLEAWARNAFG